LLRPHRPRLCVLAVVTLLGALASACVPLLVRRGVDDGVLADRPGAVQQVAAALAGLAVTTGVVTAVRVWLSGTVTEAVLAELRRMTTVRVLALTPPELRGIGPGDVLARATGDVETLGQASRQSVPVLVRNVTLVSLATAVLLHISLPLGAVGLVGLLVVAAAGRRLLRRTRVIYPGYRNELGALLATMRETLVGVRVVQAFGGQDHRANAYGRLNQRVVDRYAEGTRARNGFFPVMISVQSVVTVTMVAVGAAMVSAGAASVGTVSAAVLSVTALYRPVGQLAEMVDQLQSARAALGRVVALLDLRPRLPAPAVPRRLPDGGTLAVRGARFSYVGGRQVLDGVDLVIEPGEVVAVVGESGAGKSTLAALVARWADPEDGQVTLGGTDLRDLSAEGLRRAVTVVPQEGHLVRGTVADNVRLARPDADDGQVVEAFARLGLREWVEGLREGVGTRVGNGGASLSAGERQLVALARVALADPRVVVLDEATSSLDPATAALVDTALHRVLAGRAVLMVAHRPESARRAHRVVELVAGRVGLPRRPGG
jgi:ABC-type multidrug transport system fused ATPase/permease subunit